MLESVIITVQVIVTQDLAPIANPQSVTTAEDTSVTFALNATDPEGQPLTYTIVSQPLHGVAVLTGNSVQYMPNQDYNGPDTLVYSVSDGVSTVQGQVTISVTPMPDNPIIPSVTKTYNAYSGQLLTVSAENGLLAGVVDPDGTAVYVLSPESLTWDVGVLNVNRDGSFTFNAALLDEVTPLTISYQVVDQNGSVSAFGTFTIHLGFLDYQIFVPMIFK